MQKLLQFTFPPSWNSDVTRLVNLTRETVLRGSVDPVGLTSQTTQRSSIMLDRLWLSLVDSCQPPELALAYRWRYCAHGLPPKKSNWEAGIWRNSRASKRDVRAQFHGTAYHIILHNMEPCKGTNIWVASAKVRGKQSHKFWPDLQANFYGASSYFLTFLHYYFLPQIFWLGESEQWEKEAMVIVDSSVE